MGLTLKRYQCTAGRLHLFFCLLTHSQNKSLAEQKVIKLGYFEVRHGIHITTVSSWPKDTEIAITKI